MEKTDGNDDLNDTLMNLRKKYEAILAKVKNPRRTPEKLFGSRPPIKFRPSIMDRALQKKNNALPTSTPMVLNKKPIFTPEDSLAVSPIAGNSSQKNQEESPAAETNNNSNRNETIQNDDTIITISSTTSEAMPQASKVSIKLEKSKSSQSSASMKKSKLEGVIARLTQPAMDKTAQTSPKSLDGVKKMARNICAETPGQVQGIEPTPRGVQTQTGDSLNRKESMSSGVSEMSDALDRVERESVIPEQSAVIPPSYSDEEQKRKGVGRTDSLPWRPPSDLHRLPSGNLLDEALPEDQDSLDETFVPAKPPTRKVFTNKRKTQVGAKLGNCSNRSSTSSKENMKPDATRAAVHNGSLKVVVESARVTRSVAKHLRDVATGTSLLEVSKPQGKEEPPSNTSKRVRKQLLREREVTQSNRNFEERTVRMSNKGVQVQETKEMSRVEVDVEEGECTFDVRSAPAFNDPVFEKETRKEAAVEEEAAIKKGQSERKRNNGTLPLSPPKQKTRYPDEEPATENKKGIPTRITRNSQKSTDGRVPSTTTPKKQEEIADIEQEVPKKDSRKAKELHKVPATAPKEVSPKKGTKKMVAEDPPSVCENSIDAHFQAESGEISVRQEEVPTITPKGISFKKVGKKAVAEDSIDLGLREGPAKEEIPVTTDRSRRETSPRKVKKRTIAEEPASVCENSIEAHCQAESEELSVRQEEVPTVTPKGNSFKKAVAEDLTDLGLREGRPKEKKETPVRKEEVPAIPPEEISHKKVRKKAVAKDSIALGLRERRAKEEISVTKVRSRRETSPRKVKKRTVAEEPVSHGKTSKGADFQEESVAEKKHKEAAASSPSKRARRKTAIEDEEIVTENAVDEGFMEEIVTNDEEVNNKQTQQPVVILSDVVIQQTRTIVSDGDEKQVSLRNKNNPCRRLEWSDDNSSPTEPRTPAKKKKQTPPPSSKASTSRGKVRKATRVADSSRETSLRRSTRERRAAPPRANLYFQCIASSARKSLFSSSSSLGNSGLTRSDSRLPSTSAIPSVLEQIPEEDESQPGPSQKRSVISGRVSKRQNAKKSTKKALDVLASSEEQNFLDLYVGRSMAELACKAPKYLPFEQVPGVRMAVTPSLRALGLGAGFLRIEPGKMKPKLVNDNHSMSLVVMQGQGEVGIGRERQVFSAYATVVVLKGIEYYVKNVNKAKPLILSFTNIVLPDDE